MRKGQKSIDELLIKTFHPHLKKRGFFETRIVSEWEKIVGKELSDRCYPVKISSRSHKKEQHYILTIEVNDSAAAVELTYLEPVLIERIATYFGFKAVHKIQTFHRPREEVKEEEVEEPKPWTSEAQEQLDRLLDDVDDEALKRSLADLGQNVWLNNKE